MRTIAILPVKSFGTAKQRLADVLGGGARQALARAMFSDTLAALRRVEGIEAIAVVTADRTAESAARGERVRVLRDPQETGQSAAARTGVEYALAEGFERVLLVPSDTPLLDPAELTGLLGRAEHAGLGLVIVPDRHGEGTNALLLAPPAAVEPSFGPGSRARHEQAARDDGVAFELAELPSLALDVDTPADLEHLTAQLRQSHGRASSTRGALRQLDRARTGASA